MASMTGGRKLSYGVLGCWVWGVLERVAEDAEHCAASPVWSLPDDDLIEGIDRIHRAEQALHAAKLHLIQQLDARDIPSTRHAPRPRTGCAGTCGSAGPRRAGWSSRPARCNVVPASTMP
jgi:hypothetical protein